MALLPVPCVINAAYLAGIEGDGVGTHAVLRAACVDDLRGRSHYRHMGDLVGADVYKRQEYGEEISNEDLARRVWLEVFSAPSRVLIHLPENYDLREDFIFKG